MPSRPLWSAPRVGGDLSGRPVRRRGHVPEFSGDGYETGTRSRRNPDNASTSGMARMTKFWGNESWREAAYAESKQFGLFGTEVEKNSQTRNSWRHSPKDLKRSRALSSFQSPCQCETARMLWCIICFLPRRKRSLKKSSPAFLTSIDSGSAEPASSNDMSHSLNSERVN